MTQLATHDQSEQVTATRTHGYRTTATNERTGTGDSHVGKGPWRTGGNPLANATPCHTEQVEEEQAPLFEASGHNPEPYPQRFTIAEASRATGKSTDQIRRAVRAGKIASTRDPDNGAYLMSLEALLAAGFDLRPQITAPPAANDLATKLEAAERRILELEADRARFEALVDNLAGLIRDLPRAIAEATPATHAGGEPIAKPKRRHWFAR